MQYNLHYYYPVAHFHHHYFKKSIVTTKQFHRSSADICYNRTQDTGYKLYIKKEYMVGLQSFFLFIPFSALFLFFSVNKIL